jgi:hypothetical protein
VQLTAEGVINDYRVQWTDFRCRQNAALVAVVRKGIKAGCPGIEFSAYSGYQSQWTKEHYGVDWSLIKPSLDLGMAGYNGKRVDIRATQQALAPVPFMGGEMYYLAPYRESGPTPDPLKWRNRVLRQCLDSGAVGIIIWYLPVMEGGAFYYTSEATAVLARYEAIFRENRRCDDQVRVEGLPEGDWFAFERGQERLVVLLNCADQPADVTAGLPAGWGETTLRDPVSGRVLQRKLPRQVSLKIPANGCRAIISTGR